MSFRRHALAAAFVVASAAGFVIPAQAQVFNPETFTLANGMQVVVIPNHRVPVVTHMLWYKVGSGDEMPGKTGLAHMVEHMMFKGTKAVPAGQFSRIVAQNGGRDNAFTTADYTAFYQNVSAAKLELVMRLESDRMADLKLDDKDFQPERQVVLEERRMRVENEPEALLDEQMNAALFTNSPYHHPVIGWRSEIEGYKLSDVVDFHRRWYAPNNAILVVAGDITARKLKPLAEKYYGAIPSRPVPVRARTQEPEPVAAKMVEMRSEDVELPSWSREYMAPSYHSGDGKLAYALQVLAEIVGGGSTGRLYQSLVVEQELASEAGAGYSPNAVGPATFSVGVAPRPGVGIERAGEAAAALLRQIAADGVTDDEVARAKDRLRAGVAFAKDSVSGSARVLGAALSAGMTIADVESWPARIGAVTAEQVDQAARAVLRDEGSVTGLLLPANPDAAPAAGQKTRMPSMGGEIR